jgi:hypothetical protein
MNAVQLDSSEASDTFGALLRQHRLRVGITQAVFAVQKLNNHARHAPRPDALRKSAYT